ncbi:MAG: DUF3307 domain-containing protein [Rhodobacteraceae bacterium]|nr:DUF3307 domain-containing protein [Paracoccaceae bacterium]
MLETIIALLFAHSLADFVFQTRAMVDHKTKFWVLSGHIAVVGTLSFAALGFASIWLVLIVTGLHLLMDFIKTYFMAKNLTSFLVDQTVHLLVILVAASQFPDAFASGIWADHSFWQSTPDWLRAIPQSWLDSLPLSMLLISGMIFATRAGGFAIGMFMKPITPDPDQGIPNAGAIIGNLERGMAFMFILTGQPQNLGFLIAAKSILRFGSAQNNRAVSEYVIIGTLCSFGWAFIVAIATISLRGLLD